jgi:D-proline reductase (dithiol) PrdB
MTVSLTARHLEAEGIPTVVMGCAKDLVEHCGVPRYVWSDFPLGNSCGKPHDVASQRAIVGLALDLLESARAPRTTVATPFTWAEDHTWKRDFWKVDDDAAKIAAQKAAHERNKAIQKEKAGTI